MFGQGLGGGVEQVVRIIIDIDKLAVRQRGFELGDVLGSFKPRAHDERRLLDRRKPLGGGHPRQNQAPHECGSRRRKVQRRAGAALNAQQVDLAQPQIIRQIGNGAGRLGNARGRRGIGFAEARQIRRIDRPHVGNFG